MAAIELHLLAAMLDQGDISPLQHGHVVEDDFVTPDGKSIFRFVSTYRYATNGVSTIPSRAIVEERFKTNVTLPDPDPLANVKGLVHEVKVARLRMRCKEISDALEVVAESADPITLLPGIERQLQEARYQTQSDEDMSFDSAIENIVVDYDSGNILPDGIPWLWPSMTKATKGLHNQEFYVIAGRPKARKTFVATAEVADAFLNHNKRVLFISPEMPPRQVMLRFTATVAALRYSEFKAGELTEEEEARFIQIARRYRYNKPGVHGATPVPVDPDGNEFTTSKVNHDVHPMERANFTVVKGTGKGVGYIEAKIEQYRPHIVLVDSFYRLAGDASKKNDADWKIVTAISRALKDLAMSQNVIILGTHQMNRGADKTLGTLANMALADAVGQDADMIIRVITAKRKTGDRSALHILGGRETPFDGVMINNRPCSDFSEIEVITSQKKILEMLTEEEEAEAEDDDSSNQPAKKTEVPKSSGGMFGKRRDPSKMLAKASAKLPEQHE